MTAIWHYDGSGWALLPPAGFPDEATLHARTAEASQLLPLAGSPTLVLVGREVQVGSGWADLMAVEPSGQVTIIEIKLARHAEARRAVVAQVLTDAAAFYGLDPVLFEQDILGRHLRAQGHNTLADAMAAATRRAPSTPRRSRPGWPTACPGADSGSSSCSTPPPTNAPIWSATSGSSQTHS